MTDIKIRQLKSNDSEENILELFNQLTERKHKRCYVAAIAYQEQCFSFVGATDKNEILAFGALVLKFSPSKGKHVGYIEDFVTHKDFRQQGIGTRLLQKLRKEANRIGLKELFLTSKEERTEARRMYQEFGFQPVETDLFVLKIKQLC